VKVVAEADRWSAQTQSRAEQRDGGNRVHHDEAARGAYLVWGWGVAFIVSMV